MSVIQYFVIALASLCGALLHNLGCKLILAGCIVYRTGWLDICSERGICTLSTLGAYYFQGGRGNISFKNVNPMKFELEKN